MRMIKFRNSLFLFGVLCLLGCNNNEENYTHVTKDIESKEIDLCHYSIVDTVVNGKSLNICYDTTNKRVAINWGKLKTTFAPLKSFDLKKTIGKEALFLTSKSFGNFQSSGEIIVDSNIVILPLLDKFYFFGIYEIFDFNGHLKINSINIDNSNISYTELAYYDYEDKYTVIAEKPSLTGDNNVIKLFTLKNGIISKKCEFLIDWSKYSNKIVRSKDEYIYYKIIQNEIKQKAVCK